MDLATGIIRQFLIEAQRRIDTAAVAFTSPSRDEFYFHSNNAAADATSEMLRSTAATFLLQCRNRTGSDDSGPLIRNRFARSRRMNSTRKMRARQLSSVGNCRACYICRPILSLV